MPVGAHQPVEVLDEFAPLRQPTITVSDPLVKAEPPCLARRSGSA
jgi:hypothetical protein